MKSWAVTLVGVAVVLAAAEHPRAQVFGPPSDLQRWLAAVDSHEPGRVDGATAEIDKWSRADLMNGVLSKLRGAVREPARSAVLKRGAMLHTDIAMLRVVTGQFVTMSSLGAPIRAPFQVHLDIARQLLDWVEPDPKKDPDVQTWYRAVSAWLLHHYLVLEIQPHLEKARHLLPDDVAVIRDSGTAAEAMAAATVQNTFARQAISPQTRFVLRSPEAHLRDAERYFRRALELDPELVEAHLRLGRTLDALGRPDEALEHLDRARSVIAEPRQLYYAHLVAGRAHESRRDPAAAAGAYQNAVEIFPFAQSALLSLARLAEARGDREAAQVFVGRVLALPWVDRDDHEDPWWTYHQGVGRNAAAIVDLLRARIMALPRRADRSKPLAFEPGPR